MVLGAIGWAVAAWAGEGPADVSVTRTLSASAEQIHAALDDWREWQALLPTDCASDWEIQDSSTGQGAQAEATYRFGPLKRRAYGAIQRDQLGVVFETEHLGRRGWFTQVTYAEGGEGRTDVTIRTPLSEPKWPFRKVFFSKVRPAWEGCYHRLLGNLERAVK